MALEAAGSGCWPPLLPCPAALPSSPVGTRTCHQLHRGICQQAGGLPKDTPYDAATWRVR